MNNRLDPHHQLEALQQEIGELRRLQLELGARLATLEGEFFCLKSTLSDSALHHRERRGREYGSDPD